MTKCRSIPLLLVVGAVLPLPLLSGCASTDPNGLGLFMPVKDIETNPMQYLETEFTLSGVPHPVTNTITAADKGFLPFHRMTFDTVVAYSNGGKIFKTQTHVLTYVNAGGPFVQVFNEYLSNTIPVSQGYSLSYRGVLQLRWQYILLNQLSASKPSELKTLRADISWPESGSEAGVLDFASTFGWIPQIMNFKSEDERCTFGKGYPASDVYETLAGSARTVECEETNANGVVSVRWAGAWLTRYGVVVGLHVVTASVNADTKVVGVKIEGAAPGSGLQAPGKQTV